MPDHDVVAVKTMSLSRNEFDKSLEAFQGTTGYTIIDAPKGQQVADLFAFALPDGQALISYQEIASATYGGLLKLPRAEVKIAFSGTDQSNRELFLSAFDIAFQRGGG
ncbi:MAG: hypothetical protein AAFV69_04095 [Pseudomonadota bacterium]